MNQKELDLILANHINWLNDKPGGERAVLTGAVLTDAVLTGAVLTRAVLTDAVLTDAVLTDAVLTGAVLTRAVLTRANFTRANFTRADFTDAVLRDADFTGAVLTGAVLTDADFTGAVLTRANFTDAVLTDADFTDANFTDAVLRGADFSGSKGLLTSKKFLSQFKKDKSGIYVYKTFGAYKTPPATWIIEKDSIIEETVNPDRCTECGSGINFATLDWIKNDSKAKKKNIWLCKILWEDTADVIVPYNTDGKARCARLQLVKIVEEK